MIKVSFLYPNKQGSRFNAEYYIDVHMPLAIRLLGPALKAVSAEIGLSSAMPGTPPPSPRSHLNRWRLFRQPSCPTT